jgi:hypothetical protein
VNYASDQVSWRFVMVQTGFFPGTRMVGNNGADDVNNPNQRQADPTGEYVDPTIYQSDIFACPSNPEPTESEWWASGWGAASGDVLAHYAYVAPATAWYPSRSFAAVERPSDTGMVLETRAAHPDLGDWVITWDWGRYGALPYWHMNEGNWLFR